MCKTLPGRRGEGENEDNVLLHERLTIDDSLALQHLVINQFLSSSDKYSPVHGHGELERERETCKFKYYITYFAVDKICAMM